MAKFVPKLLSPEKKTSVLRSQRTYYRAQTVILSLQRLSSHETRRGCMKKKITEGRSMVKLMLVVFFPATRGLWIMLTHRQARPSIQCTTENFSVVFVMQFNARDRTFRPKGTDNFIMTMPQLIQLNWSRFSSSSITCRWFAWHYTLLTQITVISGCSRIWRWP